MIEDVLAELARSLAALGVREAEGDRVLAEARDHLEEAARAGEDPVRRFGDPKEVARLVAAELATQRTCRATFAAFGALALAGAAFVAALALVPAAGGWPDLFAGRLAAVGPIAGLAIFVFPQVAFVSGSLALLRAARLRAAPAAGREELGLMRRRTNVALATAAGSLVAVAVFAVDDQRELAGWWTWSTVAISLALLLPLGAAAYAVSDTVCPYAAPGGRAGDVFDDLGPLFRLGPLRRLDLARHPWRFALLSGAAAGCAVFGLGWYAEGDPGSGLVRGVFEAVALVGCFVLFGRRLGLRRSESEGALDQHR